MSLVSSSNIATVMLANKVSKGDADVFVDAMNEKARTIQMTNTSFYGATGAAPAAYNGLYAPQNYDNNEHDKTTVRDLAIMVYNLIKDFPQVLEFTSKSEVIVMENTPYAEIISNSNYSLENKPYEFPGVDGLKSGSSPTADFNLVATAQQNDIRLIAIVLGTGTWLDMSGNYHRHHYINSLFYKGFNELEKRVVLPAGDHKINGKNINLTEDFVAIIESETEPNFSINNGTLSLNNDNTFLNADFKEQNIQIKEYSWLEFFIKNQSLNTLLLIAALIFSPLYFVAIFAKRKLL